MKELNIILCAIILGILLFTFECVNFDNKYSSRITELEESKSIYEYRILKLEQYKTSTEPIISGLNDEIKELRAITDEFRAQIKGLQKEVFIGVQKEGM